MNTGPALSAGLFINRGRARQRFRKVECCVSPQSGVFNLNKLEVIKLETWIPLIKEIGFPVVVTFYLLHRIEGKLNTLIESIHALPEKMK